MTPNEITIINYPGSKRRLINFINDEISKISNDKDVILDIFAGTHVVGYSQKDKHKIIANDVELYSKVIGEVLLKTNDFNFSQISDTIYEKVEQIKHPTRYFL